MTYRDQLIQELQDTPDILIAQLLEYLHHLKGQETASPFARFIGILSDEEAQEIRTGIQEHCRAVESDEW